MSHLNQQVLPNPSLPVHTAESMPPSTNTSAKNYLVSESAEVLSAVKNIGINLAIWQRQPDPLCQTAIEELLKSDTPLSFGLTPTGCSEVAQALSQSRALAQTSALALAKDIWHLVGIFCDVADTNAAHVRLERVEDDGCRLFHADSLRIRMLCTYAGPGTEWVENSFARYEELGSRERTVDEANSAIVTDPSKVQHVDQGHVLVFTGRLREDTLPLIHRSAPVPSIREHRIRLCIDLDRTCSC